MSRARTLAGAIGSDGALNVADVAGLAAVASSGSASDLSTGTLPIARVADGAVSTAKLADGGVHTGKIADSAVTAAKLHTTAVTDKLGYTPSSARVSDGFYTSAYGSVWIRVASVVGRYSYKVTVTTTGGWYGPGSTTFLVCRDWGNYLYATAIAKLGSQYVSQVRATGVTPDGDWALEILFPVDSRSGNATTYFDGPSTVHVEALGPVGTIYSVGYAGTSLSSLGYTTNAVTL